MPETLATAGFCLSSFRLRFMMLARNYRTRKERNTWSWKITSPPEGLSGLTIFGIPERTIIQLREIQINVGWERNSDKF